MTETFVLNTKPVAKGRPRLGRWGAFTPQKTRDAEEEVRWFFRNLWKHPIITGPVEVSLVFQHGHKKNKGPKVTRSDIDNQAKLILDCLNEIVVLDDAQVWKLDASKVWGKDDSITVTITWGVDK